MLNLLVNSIAQMDHYWRLQPAIVSSVLNYRLVMRSFLRIRSAGYVEYLSGMSEVLVRSCGLASHGPEAEWLNIESLGDSLQDVVYEKGHSQLSSLTMVEIRTAVCTSAVEAEST